MAELQERKVNWAQNIILSAFGLVLGSICFTK